MRFPSRWGIWESQTEARVVVAIPHVGLSLIVRWLLLLLLLMVVVMVVVVVVRHMRESGGISHIHNYWRRGEHTVPLGRRRQALR